MSFLQARQFQLLGAPFFTLRTRFGFAVFDARTGMCGVWGSVVCKTMGTVVDFRQVEKEELEETEPGGLAE